jgi:hypothetical protein
MPTEESTTQEPRSVFEWGSDSESESESQAGGPVQDDVLPHHKDLVPLRRVIRRTMNSAEARRKSWTVTAKIDPGASWTSREFLAEAEVGHVWIHVTSPLGDSTEFGFYPQEEAAVQSVPGQIICPDEHGGDTEHKTVTVDLEAVVRGYHAAFARRDAKYHLSAYNCASFASDVWKAMTGAPLPNGLVIPNPASTAQAVRTERDMRKAFGEQSADGDVADLIDMMSSGLVAPGM